MKAWIGVDVSKLTLDICWFDGETPFFLKIDNNLKGFNTLKLKLPENAHLVMEATGAYYLRFANFLFEHKIPVSVVNPISIKRFGQMKLSRAKTDKHDSALIARYAESQMPEAWAMPDAKIMQMQQLCRREETLIVMRGMSSNEEEAFSQNPCPSKVVLKSIAGVNEEIENHLAKIRAELERLAKEFFAREMEILCSIPGMGVKTSYALIVATKGFREKVNGRELCSYVGIAPRTHESGTSIRGRGRISKMGSRSVRNKIYMCTLTAIKSNVACKTFYERLRKNGKPAKVALIAVAAKLLRQAAAMINNDKLFDEKLAMGG